MSKKHVMPKNFSTFAWAIGAFCFPITMYPVFILLSPNLTENPELSSLTLRAMTIFLWAYPIFLALWARVAYVWHKKDQRLGKLILSMGFMFFYGTLWMIFRWGFIIQA